MEDTFAASDFVVSVDGSTPRRRVFTNRVHAKTLGRALTCELDLSVVRMHLETIIFIDAFVQLYELEPISYI